MDRANDAGWAAAEHFNYADHDFNALLNFESLDDLSLDFPLDYHGPGVGREDASQQITADLAQSLDAHHLFSPHILAEQQRNAVTGNHRQHDGTGTSAMPQQKHTNTAFYDFGATQFNAASNKQGHQPRPGVPPTPNSAEFHGDTTHYLQQMQAQGAMFDLDTHPHQGEASFTPLGTPAVTPYESQSHMSSFTIAPGAYFSPLTSPALTAQDYQHMQLQQSQYTNPASSNNPSPLDVDVDMFDALPLAQEGQPQRLRTSKSSASGQGNGSRGVSQSPIVKPRRRKTTAGTAMSSKGVSELVGQVHGSTSTGVSPNAHEAPRSCESSEFDSISPERLCDMPPPPLPPSVMHSPAVFPQGSQGSCPATPASLMRLQKSPSFSDAVDGQPALDDLMLPEPSLDKSASSRVDTAILLDDAPSAHVSSRKTPKLTPLSTPCAGVAQSGKPSPMLQAVPSPTSSAFAQVSGKRTDSKSGRGIKKRGSVSTMVSPAIRPKISPSIKPMISDAGNATDAHTLLLASKSNYQNLLDGTTVPGVVYPTSLSTNLTSKRTSHKLAEQGRRNRINQALTEMQALLPPVKAGTKEALADLKSPELTATQSNASKAVKVERAIEYIKQLQKDVSEKDSLLSKKDQENEALRKELEALKNSGATPAPPSAAAAAAAKEVDEGDGIKNNRTEEEKPPSPAERSAT